MISDDADSRLFHHSDTIRKESGGTSNPRPLETFSEFGDAACGEPLVNQRLTIDFTPNDDDTDFLQSKVSSFWQLINNSPEIQNLKAKPETAARSMSSMTSETRDNYQPKDNCLDMLESVEEKGMITSTFETKLPRGYCSISSHDSKDAKVMEKETRQRVSRRLVTRKPCPVKKLPPLQAKLLCEKLEEWDEKHPKSMEPPGHPPPLQHCIIQQQF